MSITLSIRLEDILAVLEQGETLADVGCDHGYLAMEAVRRGICRRVIASDVRRGPLERAREHIEGAGLQDSIELKLRSGLEGLRRGEADLCVIASMGGRLISDILTTALEDPDNGIHGLKQLVLEPQSELFLVRRTLKEYGWSIRDERLSVDREKTYFILDCVRNSGLQPENTSGGVNDRFSLPLLKKRDPLYRELLLNQLRKNEQIRDSLDPGSHKLRTRIRELTEESETIRKVLETWY